MIDAPESSLGAILRSIPGLSEHCTIAPLSGGITNRNYRVESGDDVFVLRIAGENTGLLGIDRDREHACAVAAAAIGVGADVVAYLPQHAALLTKFVAGQVLSAIDAARPGVLARAVDALRRLHAGPSVPGEFLAFRVISDYHRLAVEHGVPLPARLDDELANLQPLATAPASYPCHNDLLPGNLIDDGTSLRIIDWEYAGMGDRFFDLGNFAENHRLTAEQEDELLQLYFGTLREDDRTRLCAMRKVSSLREAMWGYVQAGISQLDFDFLGYADEHWQRFLNSPVR